MIDKLIWFFANFGAYRAAGISLVPILVGVCVYQSQYPYVLLRGLWVRAFGDGFRPYTKDDAPALAMTIPTLLRNEGDLEGLKVGIASALASGYPGALTILAIVDGLDAAPELVRALEAWVAAQQVPAGFHVEVIGTETRVGKAFAGDVGVRHIAALAAKGAIAKPRIYFNMDADCELGPHALERMVRALVRKSRLSGQPGMVVTSHVVIRESEYWKGWRHFFTLRGQIAINVAREYLVAIGVGRHNAFRILPQNGASGALYCTWFEVMEAAPHYARFMRDLRWRDWAAWWLGAAPPRFDPGAIEPLPEAMTGMGEDTWISWLALTGRMIDGRVSLALPRTPAHAIAYALVGFFARPFRYDPYAKIYTTTPTTLRALFLQRMRWNVTRIWTVHTWGVVLLYQLVIGLPALFDVFVSTAFQALIVGGLLLAPLAPGHAPAMATAMFLMVEIGYFGERVLATVIGLVQDPEERGQWRKLLALPFAGSFHFAFNVGSTIVGFARQVFGNGYNDKFAPETTLVKGGTTRIALGYRIRRFYALCWRSVVHGDVPLGWFWLGWHETKWTPNGYEGWTSGMVPAVVHPVPPKPVLVPTPVRTVVASAVLAPVVADAELPDSGIRRRAALALPAVETERVPPVASAN